jgi:hypothetical protein
VSTLARRTATVRALIRTDQDVSRIAIRSRLSWQSRFTAGASSSVRDRFGETSGR